MILIFSVWKTACRMPGKRESWMSSARVSSELRMGFNSLAQTDKRILPILITGYLRESQKSLSSIPDLHRTPRMPS